MIDGVSQYNNITDKFSIYVINVFSDHFMSLIREHLSRICHGLDTVLQLPDTFTYKETVKEFNLRYSNKSENIKKGMIGELLTHVILLYEESYSIASPYFNMEERSIKKGFDLILIDERESSKYWITEVKSGNGGTYINSNIKTKQLIHTAKRDLIDRLNENNAQIWFNAMNGARLSIAQPNLRNEVVRLLNVGLMDTFSTSANSASKCVILVGVLFNDISDSIDLKVMNSLYTTICSECHFSDVKIIALHKETYQKVATFLNDKGGTL